MAFDTPKHRRDEYLESWRRTGGDKPNDLEIAAVTGYHSPWMTFKLLLKAAMLLGSLMGIFYLAALWYFSP